MTWLYLAVSLFLVFSGSTAGRGIGNNIFLRVPSYVFAIIFGILAAMEKK
jgi:hypothetical protein